LHELRCLCSLSSVLPGQLLDQYLAQKRHPGEQLSQTSVSVLPNPLLLAVTDLEHIPRHTLALGAFML
jgi:hypothetical protein